MSKNNLPSLQTFFNFPHFPFSQTKTHYQYSTNKNNHNNNHSSTHQDVKESMYENTKQQEQEHEQEHEHAVENKKKMNEEDEMKICVRRDKEEICIDQEIPLENFVFACENGLCRMMTEDKIKHEYLQTMRVARSVSLQSNMSNMSNMSNIQNHNDTIIHKTKTKTKTADDADDDVDDRRNCSIYSETKNYNHNHNHNHNNNNGKEKTVHFSLCNASLMISNENRINHHNVNHNDNNVNHNDNNVNDNDNNNDDDNVHVEKNMKSPSNNGESCMSSSWSESSNDHDDHDDDNVNEKKEKIRNERRYRTKRFSSCPSQKTFRLMSPTRYNFKSTPSSPITIQ